MEEYGTCVCERQEELRDIGPHGYQLPPMSLEEERRLSSRGSEPERIGEILERAYLSQCEESERQATERERAAAAFLLLMCFLRAICVKAPAVKWGVA